MSNTALIQSAYSHLNAAEKRFVDDYVRALEAAAKRAGEQLSYALDRPIPQALLDASGGMLGRPLVNAAIHIRVTEIARASELSQERVVREYMNVAFSNIGDYMEVDPVSGGPMFNFHDVSREEMATVASVEYIEDAKGGRTMKLKFHNKLEALKQCAIITGLTDAENEFMYRNGSKSTRTSIANNENAGDAYAQMLN